MGLVYNICTGVVDPANNLKHAYAGNPTAQITDALIDPGKDVAQQALDPMDAQEVDRLLLKLDALAPDSVSESVARVVAMAASAIIELVQIVKNKSNHQPFVGALGASDQLDIQWMRACDIGNPALRGTAAAGALGIYAQAPLGAGTFTWLRTFVEHTAQNIIPLQVSDKNTGVIHMGFQDSIEVPKIMNFIFGNTATNLAIPQPVVFSKKKMFGSSQDIPVARFERPIIVPPTRGQILTLVPGPAGDDRPELLSLIVGQASDFTSNV